VCLLRITAFNKMALTERGRIDSQAARDWQQDTEAFVGVSHLSEYAGGRS
jgi:hypothetical protein